MINKIITDFDIQQIADSGQCFRLNQIASGKFSLIASGIYLEIEKKDHEYYFTCSDEEYDTIWSFYFDMDTDYHEIKEKVDKEDTYMQNAISHGGGIRILRQELWETIITFIISQQNNIPRIKKCVELLCQNFGEKRYLSNGQTYFTFPDPEVLADLNLEELSNCNLGYRGRYILQTAKAISQQDVSLRMLKEMDYENSKKELMKLCGVGIKVAECVCLFALHHIDAFPIDTHIQKVLDNYYPNGFPFQRYLGFAGILQQYAFYYDVHKIS